MKAQAIKIALLTFVGLNLGCSKVDFQPGQETSQPSQPATDTPTEKYCSTNQIQMTRPTRVVFAVDQSGSNVSGPTGSDLVPTDPEKAFRKKILQEFFVTNQSKSHLSWGLTVFSGSTASNLMTDGAGSVVPFSSKPENFLSALFRFQSREDRGLTPYRQSLRLIREMIKNDLLSAPQEVAYLIGFVTDGYPTDYCPGGSFETECPGQVMESEIDRDVQAIVALAPTVKFSTLYYGRPDSEAALRLERMAKVGRGQFVDINVSSDVSLNDILEVEEQVCVERPVAP